MPPAVRFVRFFAFLSCWTFVCTPSARAADAPDDVEFKRDVVYGKGGDVELQLNISMPKKREGALPCIVVLHGGGWAAGSREQHNDLTWKFAQMGYVSATVTYRFAPDHPFPAQVNDVKCAVRFLRAHASGYSIDPEHIGAVGFSAGAHLSMMLGTVDKEADLEGDGGWPEQSSKVQAVVSFFGPTDLLAPDIPTVTQPILDKFFGGRPTEKRADYLAASPLQHLSPGDAPMLLFQGTNDPLVPYSQAVAMAVAMHRMGVAGRVELLPGLGHGWGGADLNHTLLATTAFFDLHLRGKEPTVAKDDGK